MSFAFFDVKTRQSNAEQPKISLRGAERGREEHSLHTKESFVILALHSVRCHEWSAGSHLRSVCAVDHTATFAVNAALVASQWQHRAQSFPLHLSTTSTRLNRLQVPFFKFSV